MSKGLKIFPSSVKGVAVPSVAVQEHVKAAAHVTPLGARALWQQLGVPAASTRQAGVGEHVGGSEGRLVVVVCLTNDGTDKLWLQLSLIRHALGVHQCQVVGLSTELHPASGK